MIEKLNKDNSTKIVDDTDKLIEKSLNERYNYAKYNKFLFSITLLDPYKNICYFFYPKKEENFFFLLSEEFMFKDIEFKSTKKENSSDIANLKMKL